MNSKPFRLHHLAARAKSLASRIEHHPAFSFARLIVGFAASVPLFIEFNSHVGSPIWISGQSMYPFFNDRPDETRRSDVCWESRLFAQDGLAPGMIVTLRSPEKPEQIIVKRVVAVAGDLVVVRVPEGHVWIEGDGGAGRSRDSNEYGPVSARLVRGRITHILWPWRKMGPVRWREWQSRQQ